MRLGIGCVFEASVPKLLKMIVALMQINILSLSLHVSCIFKIIMHNKRLFCHILDTICDENFKNAPSCVPNLVDQET